VIFGRAKSPVAIVDVHLNARLQPIHRGELFEDPLDAALKKLNKNSRVIGGGSELSAEYEVLACDIEIAVADEVDRTLSAIVALLESRGAPQGSRATVRGGEGVDFGTWQGTGLYIDGTTAPPEEADDVNLALPSILRSLGDDGQLLSWWHGPRETAMYFYGPSHAVIASCIRRAVDNTSFAKDSRLMQLT
jgi:hypothetical protein